MIYDYQQRIKRMAAIVREALSAKNKEQLYSGKNYLQRLKRIAA